MLASVDSGWRLVGGGLAAVVHVHERAGKRSGRRLNVSDGILNGYSGPACGHATVVGVVKQQVEPVVAVLREVVYLEEVVVVPSVVHFAEHYGVGGASEVVGWGDGADAAAVFAG
ncbi:MAG: hypothetical protein N3E40_06265 [Dehalococcoidia bacterium]|nr:hypothetical protein [Dehalococcoidia bacterium]